MDIYIITSIIWQIFTILYFIYKFTTFFNTMYNFTKFLKRLTNGCVYIKNQITTYIHKRNGYSIIPETETTQHNNSNKSFYCKFKNIFNKTRKFISRKIFGSNQNIEQLPLYQTTYSYTSNDSLDSINNSFIHFKPNNTSSIFSINSNFNNNNDSDPFLNEFESDYDPLSVTTNL